MCLAAKLQGLEIETGADVVGLVVVVKDVLLGGVDMIMDMLFAYSPVLASDRERIENEAYDDEAITAFAEVLKLAYPLELLLTAWNGPSATPTLQNSPSTNGKFGTRQTERQGYLEDLLASYVSRKRWEYREQALAHFGVYGEINSSKQRDTEQQPTLQARNGKNYGSPPLMDLAKVGFLVPQ